MLSLRPSSLKLLQFYTSYLPITVVFADCWCRYRGLCKDVFLLAACSGDNGTTRVGICPVSLRCNSYMKHAGGRPGALTWAVQKVKKNSQGCLRCVPGKSSPDSPTTGCTTCGRRRSRREHVPEHHYLLTAR